MDWKVSKEKIELSVHPNADALEIGKVGSYQVVVQKGLYENGDEIIFVPEKSVLKGKLKSEFEKYLVGSNNDRVKAARLRGEISSGIIIPKHLVEDLDIDSFDIGEDVSEKIGITKYEPPIPEELKGKVQAFDIPFVGNHDCMHANVYLNDLKNGERVVITEKLHGTQISLVYNFDDNSTMISSKGMLKSGLEILESDENLYWIAAKNDDIVGKIKRNFTQGVIQIFGELIPAIKKYNYGQSKPTIKIFDIRVNGESIPYDKAPPDLCEIWVPTIYDGTLQFIEKEVVLYENKDKGIRKTRIDNLLPKFIVNLSKGKELVSGEEKHIREGIVIRPYVDRCARDGTKLRLKLINPKYKETGEEIN